MLRFKLISIFLFRTGWDIFDRSSHEDQTGQFLYLFITMTDYFTKWPEAQGIPDKTAKTVSEFLYKMIMRYGCMDIVISDRGREFVNKVFDSFSVYNIKEGNLFILNPAGQ